MTVRRSSLAEEPRGPELRDRPDTTKDVIAKTLERFGLSGRTAEKVASKAALPLELAPGVGEFIAARDAKNAFSVGDIFGGAVSAAGAIPGFGMVGRLGKRGMGLFAAKRLEQAIVASQTAAQKLGDKTVIAEIQKEGRMLAHEAEQLLVDKELSFAARNSLDINVNKRQKFLEKFTADQEQGVAIFRGNTRKGQRTGKSADILHAPEGFGK